MFELNTKIFTDIKLDGLLSKHCPQELMPYLLLARLDRPTGIWLLLLPGLWAIVLSAGGVTNMNAHDWYVAFLFLIGSVVMRAAGCIINDLWDVEFDKKVTRTKQRPLAAGTITRQQAHIFLGALLFCGAWILFQLSFVSILLGILSVPLIVAYPFMKRITWWPQAFLGIVFNFGILMGWAAVTGILDTPALVLYAAGIFWTLAYDTIYAHQDKEDDALVGIKSTALKFGEKSKDYVVFFYCVSWILTCVATASHLNEAAAPFMFIPALAFMMRQMYEWDEKSAPAALGVFKNTAIYGLYILAGIAIAAL